MLFDLSRSFITQNVMTHTNLLQESIFVNITTLIIVESWQCFAFCDSFIFNMQIKDNHKL